MYHTEKRNQAIFDKNLTITRFASKDLQIADYPADIDSYMAGGTLSEQSIGKVFYRYSDAPFIKLTNATIAKEAGCSIRTVTRATTKFHRDGFITKNQDNTFSPNNFTLNEKFKKPKKEKQSFSTWMNSLSPQNQDLYISHGIRIDHKKKMICQYEYGQHNKSINLILDNLFINLSPSSRLSARGGRIFKKINNLERGRVMKPKQEPKKQGIYAPWKTPKQKSLEEQRVCLKKEIELCEIMLDNPNKYFAFCLKESIKRTEKRLVECLEELIELERRSNEKQSILRQSDTCFMEATCA
jgi:hypothetical protein